MGFFGGMSVGSGVVVSHIFGARDKSGLSRAVHNAMALSLVGGILLCVGGYFLAPVYLRLVNTPESLQAACRILSPNLFLFFDIYVPL